MNAPGVASRYKRIQSRILRITSGHYPVIVPGRYDSAWRANDKETIMQRNDYGDLFLSPESAIEAILDASDWEDDALADEVTDDAFELAMDADE
jgi:hypothetical protein